MDQNHYQWGREHTPIEKTRKKGGMHEVSNFDHMIVNVDVLYKKLDNLSITHTTTSVVVTPNYKIYGVSGHIGVECQLLAKLLPDQVSYAQLGNPYSNTCNPG